MCGNLFLLKISAVKRIRGNRHQNPIWNQIISLGWINDSFWHIELRSICYHLNNCIRQVTKGNCQKPLSKETFCGKRLCKDNHKYGFIATVKARAVLQNPSVTHYWQCFTTSTLITYLSDSMASVILHWKV